VLDVSILDLGADDFWSFLSKISVDGSMAPLDGVVHVHLGHGPVCRVFIDLRRWPRQAGVTYYIFCGAP
jgi:hypothetical protein